MKTFTSFLLIGLFSFQFLDAQVFNRSILEEPNQEVVSLQEAQGTYLLLSNGNGTSPRPRLQRFNFDGVRISNKSINTNYSYEEAETLYQIPGGELVVFGSYIDVCDAPQEIGSFLVIVDSNLNVLSADTFSRTWAGPNYLFQVSGEFFLMQSQNLFKLDSNFQKIGAPMPLGAEYPECIPLDSNKFILSTSASPAEHLLVDFSTQSAIPVLDTAVRYYDWNDSLLFGVSPQKLLRVYSKQGLNLLDSVILNAVGAVSDTDFIAAGNTLLALGGKHYKIYQWPGLGVVESDTLITEAYTSQHSTTGRSMALSDSVFAVATGVAPNQIHLEGRKIGEGTSLPVNGLNFGAELNQLQVLYSSAYPPGYMVSASGEAEIVVYNNSPDTINSLKFAINMSKAYTMCGFPEEVMREAQNLSLVPGDSLVLNYPGLRFSNAYPSYDIGLQLLVKPVAANKMIIAGKHRLTSWDSLHFVSTPEYKTQNLAVFPNPFSNDLHIDNPTPIEWKGEIMDVTGRVCKNFTIASSGTYYLNTVDLAEGIYLLKMTDKHGYVQKQQLLKY